MVQFSESDPIMPAILDTTNSEARILEDDRYIRHSHFESLRLLRRSILQHGGIRADYDYPRDSIPRGVYRKAGLPLDIMAGEVGFESADELLGALE